MADSSEDDDALVAPVEACSNFFDDLAKNVQHPEFMKAMSAALSNIDISAALVPVPAENTFGSSGFTCNIEESQAELLRETERRSAAEAAFQGVAPKEEKKKKKKTGNCSFRGIGDWHRR